MLAALSLVAVFGLARLSARPAGAAEADDRAARVQKLDADRSRLDEERRGLERELDAKTKDIAALKKQRASWSRDQKLDKRLREAKDIAGKLEQKAAQITALDKALRAERQALVNAVDRELGRTPPPPPARRTQLGAWRKDASGKLGGGRRLKVADENISPYDDPEDLDEKAATLEESEADLRAEEQRLGRRVAYYRKQVKLERAKARASEGDVFDDAPRRGGTSGGRGGGDGAAQGIDDKAPSGGNGGAPNPAPPAGPASGFEGSGDSRDPVGPSAEPDLGGDPAVIYADVVDPDTALALERAEKSGDPEAKAKAAEQAQQAVRARADRLRQKRLEMQKRAQELRRRAP
jgi:hypothetical protein